MKKIVMSNATPGYRWIEGTDVRSARTRHNWAPAIRPTTGLVVDLVAQFDAKPASVPPHRLPRLLT